jgi:hypothetical protein
MDDQHDWLAEAVEREAAGVRGELEAEGISPDAPGFDEAAGRPSLRW